MLGECGYKKEHIISARVKLKQLNSAMKKDKPVDKLVDKLGEPISIVIISLTLAILFSVAITYAQEVLEEPIEVIEQVQLLKADLSKKQNDLLMASTSLSVSDAVLIEALEGQTRRIERKLEAIAEILNKKL